MKGRRRELLAALLTIWRWGRLDTGLSRGRPLGSFEQWGEWVRDPLLTLGCQDPAERISEAKERDGRRQVITDLFKIWWQRHESRPVPIRELHDDVRQAVDPQGRGRQFLASSLERLVGTRMAGFVLTRQAPVGTWGVATYALERTGVEDGHRGHGGHRVEEPPLGRSDTPDPPYADGSPRSNGRAETPALAPMPPMPSHDAPRSEPEKSNGQGWSMRL